MTSTQAGCFVNDIRSNLRDGDYCQTIYISIRDVGTKAFENACCQSIEGWLFIWTKDESFYVREKNLGDLVCVDTTTMPAYTLYKEKSTV